LLKKIGDGIAIGTEICCKKRNKLAREGGRRQQTYRGEKAVPQPAARRGAKNVPLLEKLKKRVTSERRGNRQQSDYCHKISGTTFKIIAKNSVMGA